MDSCSALWAHQRNSGVVAFTDPTTPSPGQQVGPPETLQRSYPELVNATDGRRLLQSQPGFALRTTFMASEEDWRFYSFPSHRGTSVLSSTVSSALSDRPDTPRLSPDTFDRLSTRSNSSFANDVPYANGGLKQICSRSPYPGFDCVAMDDVQKFLDESPADTYFSIAADAHHWAEFNYPPHLVHDGYVPIGPQNTNDITTPATYHSTPTTSEETSAIPGASRHESEELRPAIRRRRTTPAHPLTSQKTLTGRTSKRSARRRQNPSFQNQRVVESEPEQESSGAPMPCPFIIYGCPRTSFGNKNEWKRHIQTKHMQLEYWRCQQCEEETPEKSKSSSSNNNQSNRNRNRKSTNDFNRRDLFIQHLLRMHPFSGASFTAHNNNNNNPAATGGTAAPATPRPPRNNLEQNYLTTEASICHHQSRLPPTTSRCIICSQNFQGPESWEKRLEHVGRHLEEMKRGNVEVVPPREWLVDRELEEYLLREGLVVWRGGRVVLVE